MHHLSSKHDSVVITGVGVLSPWGSGFDSLRSAFDHAHASPPSAPTTGLLDSYSGSIDDFGTLPLDRKRSLRKSMKLMNRETQLGVAAAFQAIQDSDLDAAAYDPDRVGVCFGAGNVEVRPEDFVAGVQACGESSPEMIEAAWGSLGIPHVDPLWVLRVLPNMPACHIAISCDYRGPNNTITQAEASANLAIQEAKYHLLDDEADAMIVGSTGTTIRIDGASETDGSEGAAAFVIERLERAQQRGATIYGEVLGIGSSCVIDATMVPKPDEAANNAIRASLAQSHLSDNGGVQFTVINDQRGSAAIDRVLESRPTDSLNLADWIGQVDAGSGAIGLAVALQRLAASDASATRSAINIGITHNGLASCLTIRNLQSSRAA
ncbi:3-oxoacyl-[acyl-carrier-protein] synthase 2 [Rosistilla ulvae]|uniref:3-oxoacyl-[acyl-carrier-protein] synthase 2 n=1 Tax=Rosistilla ulvae TaxID=1930277 RepID=A0A517M3Z6_9BACT|nr:beta-ketoacyl synthase N-terminal-like domain-containing protein [Rosistilla ulvae]QDS89605.1 3-oxoacyl-[acyl-carrier-protein] synthase 2 [Rosistilla ulvae]